MHACGSTCPEPLLCCSVVIFVTHPHLPASTFSATAAHRQLQAAGLLTLRDLLGFYPKSHRHTEPGRLPEEDDDLVCLPVVLKHVKARGGRCRQRALS